MKHHFTLKIFYLCDPSLNQNIKGVEREINLSNLLRWKTLYCSVSVYLLWPGSVALVSTNPLGFQALARDDHTQVNPSSLQITSIFPFFSAPPNTFTSIGQLWVQRHSYFLYVKQLLCKQSYNVTSTLLLTTAVTIITDKFLTMQPHRKRSCPNLSREVTA